VHEFFRVDRQRRSVSELYNPAANGPGGCAQRGPLTCSTALVGQVPLGPCGGLGVDGGLSGGSRSRETPAGPSGCARAGCAQVQHRDVPGAETIL